MSRQRVANAMLADNAVTSAKILDGTIATADVADRAISYLKLASDVARANLLTNPGLEVWQRGTGPFTGQSAKTADRWFVNLAGGSTDAMSTSREATIVDVGSSYSAALTYTRGTGGLPETALYQGLSPVPGEYAHLMGRTCTFSARVRTSTANMCRLSWGTPAGRQAFSPYHNGDGTWQTLSITWTIPAGIAALYVNFEMNNASGTAYVDNAVMVLGSVAVDYVPLHPADDLARCQRYFEIIGETPLSIQLGAYTNGGLSYWFPYKVRKPIVPTATKNGTWATNNANQPTIDHVGLDGCQLSFTALAAGYSAIGNNGAGNNITVEANP